MELTYASAKHKKAVLDALLSHMADFFGRMSAEQMWSFVNDYSEVPWLPVNASDIVEDNAGGACDACGKFTPYDELGGSEGRDDEPRCPSCVEKRLAAWYEQCSFCGVVEHFRELDYDPYTGRWTCMLCQPKYDGRTGGQAYEVEQLERIMALEPPQTS